MSAKKILLMCLSLIISPLNSMQSSTLTVPKGTQKSFFTILPLDLKRYLAILLVRPQATEQPQLFTLAHVVNAVSQFIYTPTAPAQEALQTITHFLCAHDQEIADSNYEDIPLLLTDPITNGALVKALAAHYFNSDIIYATFRLRTPGARLWLKQNIDMTIQDPSFSSSNLKKEFIDKSSRLFLREASSLSGEEWEHISCALTIAFDLDYVNLINKDLYSCDVHNILIDAARLDKADIIDFICLYDKCPGMDSFKQTLLRTAIYAGNESTAALLIVYQTDIKAINPHTGLSYVIEAVIAGKPALVKLLLEAEDHQHIPHKDLSVALTLVDTVKSKKKALRSILLTHEHSSN